MTIALGFDFGMKFIGVAIGQSLTKTATPLLSLRAKEGIPNWNEIKNLIEDWKPNVLIVGIPLNMDGTTQPLTFAAKQFAEALQTKFELPIHLVDERLSTFEAKDRIFSKENYRKQNPSKKLRKKIIEDTNAMSAVILIEQWFSEQKM